MGHYIGVLGIRVFHVKHETFRLEAPDFADMRHTETNGVS